MTGKLHINAQLQEKTMSEEASMKTLMGDIDYYTIYNQGFDEGFDRGFKKATSAPSIVGFGFLMMGVGFIIGLIL